MNNHPAKISQPVEGEPSRYSNFANAIDELLLDAKAAHEARVRGNLRGPVTGFKNLDRDISFALAPGIHGILGNAGAGKTAFALQIAANCGFPCLYVTCEMSPQELLRRHTARATETYLGRLKSGELPPEQVELLTRRALNSAQQIFLLDATLTPVSPQRIYDFALLTKGNAPSVLVVVDSLQSWAECLVEGGLLSEYEGLNLGLKALRGVAHQLKCPVLFISERNREGMRTGGLNSGAGSRKIEYGTETVFDLDRDSNAKENGAGEIDITLNLVKNRHGSVGRSIPLQFNGALQRFRERTT